MISLNDLRGELANYNKNVGYFEKDSEFILVLKEIAKKQTINDDDQLEILKNLILLSKSSQTLNSKACDKSVSYLKSVIGLEKFKCCQILVENNLLTTNNLKIVDYPHILKSIQQLVEKSNSNPNPSLDQRSIDFLLLCAKDEEFDYKESRIKFYTDFIIELKKYNLFDETNYIFLYQAMLSNVDDNLRIKALESFKLCLMPEDRVLEKDKIYIEINSVQEDSFDRLKLQYTYLDSSDNPIVTNARWFQDSELRKLLPLPFNQLQRLFSKIISNEKGDNFVKVRESLSKIITKNAFEKRSYNFNVDKLLKANLDNSFGHFYMEYNPTVKCIKIIEFMHNADLINAGTIDCLFHCDISNKLLSIISDYYDSGLLDENNFKKLTSLDSEKINKLADVIHTLAKRKLLSQAVLNAILPGYRFIKNNDFRSEKKLNPTYEIEELERDNDEPNLTAELMENDCLYFYIDISTEMECFAVKNDKNEIKKIEVSLLTRSINYYEDYNFSASKNGYPLLNVHPDIKEIFQFINLKHLIITPDSLAKILLSNKIQEVLDVIQELSHNNFLNKESFKLLMSTDQKIYGRMLSCIRTLGKKSLLTLENLKDTLCFDNPLDKMSSDLIAGMELLNNLKMLNNDANRNMIKYSSYPSSLAKSLIILSKHGLSSNRNTANLTLGYTPEYEKLLTLLSNSNQLSQDNFDKIFSRVDKATLCNLILELSERIHITTARIDILAETNEPRKTQIILSYLHAMHLLNDQNQCLYSTHLNKNELCQALYGLALNDVDLTQAQLDIIFLHAAILGRDPELFTQLPPHLINDNLFLRISIICSTNQDINTKLELINNHIQQLLNRPIPIPRVLNSAQSTHTASIHRSVSESATKLKNNYSHIFEKKGKEALLQEIKAYIAKLPGDKSELTNKNSAAKRAMDSLKKAFWQFEDPSSKVSNLEILILAWVALNDDKKRDKDCTLSQAKTCFVNGLYELIRGYNLDDSANDDGQPDNMICSPGGFNKIVESLNTIHPDVTIVHITMALANIELKIRSTDNIINALNISELSADEIKALRKQLDNPDSVYTEEIYKNVKTEVHSTLLEYRSLFKTDRDYIDFIDSGFWVIDNDKIDKAIDSRLASFEKPVSVLESKLDHSQEQNDITTLREKINSAILGKAIITNARALPENNDKSYLGWMNNNTVGIRGFTRFSHWFHGDSGIKRARELLEVANNPESSYSEILTKLQNTFNDSSQHKHSLSRYLVAQFDQSEFDVFEQLSDKKFDEIKSNYRF